MPSNEPDGLGRRLAANTFHVAIGRVAALLVQLLLTPPLLRALGPEGYAVWALFFALTGWLTALDLGLAPGTLRHVAAARARGDEPAAGAFATLSALGYVLLGALWLALTPLVREPVLAFLHVTDAARPAADFAFVAGAVVFILAGLSNTIVAVLQGWGRFDLGNMVVLSLAAGQAAGFLLVLSRGGGVPGVVLATAGGWLLSALVGLAALRRGAPGFRWAGPRAAFRRTRETLRYGAPMQLGNMFAVAHQQIDKVLLARFVMLAAITPYDLGLRIANAASTLPQMLILALVPAATALHAAGEAPRFAELCRRANRYLLLAAAAVTAGLCAGAERLFAAWLGAPSPDAALALRGLMAAAACGLAAGMATVAARAAARTDLEAEFSIVAFLVHLALGVWLVRTHQIAGAVIALAIGNAAGAAWFLARTARVFGWPFARMQLAPLVPPVFALGAGLAAGLALDHALPIRAGLAAWPGVVMVSGLAAAVAAGLLLVTRYVAWGELGVLLRAGRT